MQLSVSRHGLIAGVCSPGLKDYMREVNSIVANQGVGTSFSVYLLVKSLSQARESEIVLHSFSIDGEKESVLWVTKMLLLSCLNTPKCSCGRKNIILKYRECIPLLEDLNKDLGCLCLTLLTTDGKYHGAIEDDKSKIETELSVSEWFQVILFSSIRSVMHVVRSKYDISSTCRALLWPFQCFYTNSVHREGLLTQKSEQNNK